MLRAITAFLLLIFVQQTLYSQSDTTNIYLDEIIVRPSQENRILNNTAYGKINLTIQQLNVLPHFLGETDPIRTLQLMPGIQTSGEMNAGMYVRGCDPGHNLLFINGAPVYNPMHMIGLFSVLNTDHTSNFTLNHNGENLYDGGHLGATLHAQTPDTIADKFGMRANIGILNTTLTTIMPLTNKSTLYLSARRSYINYMLELINREQDELNINYLLQDYNATYTRHITSNSRIIANFYYGSDQLVMKDPGVSIDSDIRWSNLASSVTFVNNSFKGKSLEQTLYYSRFANRIGLEQVSQTLLLPSELWETGYRGSLKLGSATSEKTLGITYSFRDLNPQQPIFNDAERINPLHLRNHEMSLYGKLKYYFGNYFSTSASLRYILYAQMGPYKREFFDANDNITGVYDKSRGQIVKCFQGFEPSISAVYRPVPSGRLTLNYEFRRQYTHQAAVSAVGFPIDFWISASRFIPPQYAHSLSLSYVHQLMDGKWQYSATLYGKRLGNQVEFFGEMFDMLYRRFYFEEYLQFGIGRSYGLELQLRKNMGSFTGWISYTPGRSQRKFEAIESGRWFDARHERRHDLSVVTIWHINRHWEMSSAFVYATGNSFTMPEKVYFINEKPVIHYGSYNAAKMAPYHRLDLSIQYSWQNSSVNLSFYNAYARKNPVFLWVKVRQDQNNGTMKIRKYGKSFYSLLPSLTYRYTFN